VKADFEELSVSARGGSLVGSKHGDVIRANPGTDTEFTLLGLGGDDRLFGNYAGNDVIDAGPGNDRVLGGGGDDQMVGSTGDDDLRGEEGDDDLDGGEGVDRCDGGADTDAAVACEELVAVP
jgi:Ca2+-binding RTX toxin-like protein